jgi:hypothetical protein
MLYGGGEMLSIHRSWVPILGSDLALTFCHRQAEDELLGTMTDRKLAKRLGRTVVAVRVRRVRLRIPIMDSKFRLWRPVDNQLLGKRPDERKRHAEHHYSMKS